MTQDTEPATAEISRLENARCTPDKRNGGRSIAPSQNAKEDERKEGGEVDARSCTSQVMY